MPLVDKQYQPLQSTDKIAATLAQLRQQFQTGMTRSYPWRVKQLQQIQLMSERHEDEIVAALNADLHKSVVESWGTEIGFVNAEIAHSIKHLKKWMKPRKVATPLIAQPAKSYMLPEPLGVVLIIGAWNYPYQLLLSPLVAAIAAGNCAILKPSELAVNTSRLLAKLLPQYLDTAAFAVVEGGVEETTALLQLRFDHILYTGGGAVGKIVMRAAAEHLTPVTLELGGKSPCIVDSRCNLKVTADRICWSKWMNAGQTCVAPDYILVERHFADQLITALQQAIGRFYGSDPVQHKDYGRIINSRHCARLQSYLEGQEVIFGGEVDQETLYISPTLVKVSDLNAAIMQEEIFGPILPIVLLDEIEQAIPFVNDRAKPLALYLFSNDPQLEHNLLHQTSAGNVCVNDGMMFMLNPNLPFGGVGYSGMGSYHGQHGFDTFSHLKTVMKRSFLFDLPVRYPPFSKGKFNLLKRLI